VHLHTNNTKIGPVDADISHLTIFKIVAIRHLGFLKLKFFEQLVFTGELMCVIVQNFSKIGQTVLKISQFFDFQDSRRLHLGFRNFTVRHYAKRGLYSAAVTELSRHKLDRPLTVTVIYSFNTA